MQQPSSRSNCPQQIASSLWTVPDGTQKTHHDVCLICVFLLFVHSRPLREHKMFALVNHCFIVVFLFKSLDELILGFSMNSIVLCRSSGKPSDFNQWPPVVHPFWMRTLRRHGTPKDDGFMCVLESIFDCVFHLGPLYNSVSKKTIEPVDTTQPSIKYGDLFWFSTNFQCLDNVPKLSLPPSATVKVLSRYLKLALMRRSCITSCFRMHLLSTTAKTLGHCCDHLQNNPDTTSVLKFSKNLSRSIIAFNKLGSGAKTR